MVVVVVVEVVVVHMPSPAEHPLVSPSAWEQFAPPSLAFCSTEYTDSQFDSHADQLPLQFTGAAVVVVVVKDAQL